LYLVMRGRLGVVRPSENGPIRLNTCTVGETIGEMALLSDRPRSATVIADEDAEVLRLDKARFLDLVQQEPEVSLAVSRGLMERLRTADAARLGCANLAEAPLPVVSDASPATHRTWTPAWRPGRR